MWSTCKKDGSSKYRTISHNGGSMSHQHHSRSTHPPASLEPIWAPLQSTSSHQMGLSELLMGPEAGPDMKSARTSRSLRFSKHARSSLFPLPPVVTKNPGFHVLGDIVDMA